MLLLGANPHEGKPRFVQRNHLKIARHLILIRHVIHPYLAAHEIAGSYSVEAARDCTTYVTGLDNV